MPRFYINSLGMEPGDEANNKVLGTRWGYYSLFALSLPTEVIKIFIDDVLSCDFDIFQIFVGVSMRAQLVGNHVVASCW